MHIDINLPVLMRAQPTATRKTDRYFFGGHIHRADVPEVALGDTDIAFGRMAMDTIETGRRVFPALRSYGGRLYRPIGNAPGLLGTAFAETSSSRAEDFMLSSPPLPDMKGGPLSSPMAARFWWFAALHGMNTDRNAKLWPESADVRKTTLLENTDLRDIDYGDLAYCRRMHEAQAARLLLIDGKMWMETTMPCIKVTHRQEGRLSVVSTSVGFVPLVPTGYGTEVRFPVSMVADALEYAAALSARGNPGADNEAPRFEINADTSAVDFNQASEELHEFAWGVASNVVRAVEQRKFHKQHEGAAQLFTGDNLVRYENMREELLTSNDILDERRDLAELIPDIMNLWNIANASRYQGLWAPASERVSHIVARNLAIFEDRDISLPFESSGPRFI